MPNMHKRAGFTLLEMMLVVVIIGILAGVAVFSISGQTENARRETTKASLRMLKSALEQYNGQFALYPASLDQLATGTTKQLDKVPRDGWKNTFMYYPGTNSNPERPFDLFSTGKDKVPNTPDDLDAWTLDDRP